MSNRTIYNPSLSAKKRLSNSLAAPWGHSISEPVPHGTPDPDLIYFTYLRINSNRQQCYVRHYYERVTDVDPTGSISAAENALFLNARLRLSQQSWKPVSQDFGYLDFVNSDCYFCLVVDERDWKLSPIDPADMIDETIVFRKEKIVRDEYGNYYEAQYDKNDAFYSGQQIPYVDPDDLTIRAGYRAQFISKGPYFDPSGDIIKQYAMDIYLKMPLFNHGWDPQYWITIVLDPPIPNPGPPKLFVPDAAKFV